MFLLIGDDGNEYGPVDAQELRQWIRDGRANADSLVRRVEETEWRPLGAFSEFLAAPVGARVSQSTHTKVVSLPSDRSSGTNTGRRDLTVFECLGEAWSLLWQGAMPILGATVVMFEVRTLIARMAPFGKWINFLLGGVILGGVFWVCLKQIRRKPGSKLDIFAGVERALIPSILIGLVTGLPWFVAGLFSGIHRSMPDDPGLGLREMFAVLRYGSLPIAFFLHALWVFAFPLAMDRELGVGEALSVSQDKVKESVWRIVGLLAALAGIVGAGFVVFWGLASLAESVEAPKWAMKAMWLIGLLVVVLGIAYYFATVTYAYEQLFVRKRRI